jgi:hypothetical protein
MEPGGEDRESHSGDRQRRVGGVAHPKSPRLDPEPDVARQAPAETGAEGLRQKDRAQQEPAPGGSSLPRITTQRTEAATISAGSSTSSAMWSSASP